jgi:hypothetical protein
MTAQVIKFDSMTRAQRIAPSDFTSYTFTFSGPLTGSVTGTSPMFLALLIRSKQGSA